MMTCEEFCPSGFVIKQRFKNIVQSWSNQKSDRSYHD